MSLPTTFLALYPFLVLFLQTAVVPERAADGQVVQLTIHPAGKQTVQRLLPPPPAKPVGEQAAKLYAEALELLPENAGQLDTGWLDSPIDAFPAEEARELLAPMEPAFRKLEEAARRGPVKWNPPPATEELRSVRALAKLLALKARLQIAEGKPAEAAQSIGTGYALARSLTEPGCEAIHAMVGVALGELFTEQLLTLSQQTNAPSLLPALQQLPEPLVDIEPAIQGEMDALRTKVPNPITRGMMVNQLKSSQGRMRQLAARLRGRLAAARMVEQLRVKAADSGGLPEKLETPKASTQPADRVRLDYRRLSTDSAELIVRTGDASEQMRYEIKLMSAIAPPHKERR